MTERFEEGDELFQRRPEEFTAARNALAKRLRSEGRKEDAALVSALRRPPITAWAMNGLARLHPELIEAVISAGDRLRGATEQTIRGDRSDFQQAQAHERGAIQAAVEAAAGLLVEGGGNDGEAARQRMTETFRAATVDPEVADQLRRGVLQSDVSSPGFGLDGLAAEITPDRSVDLPSVQAEAEATERKREQDARIADLERDLAAATSRLYAAQAAVAEAETDVNLVQNRLDQERAKAD